MFQLHNWLLDRTQPPPEAQGYWGEIFNELHLMEKEKRKRRRTGKAGLLLCITMAGMAMCPARQTHGQTDGFLTIARPTATRCRCPPDSAFGLLSSNVSMPRISAASLSNRMALMRESSLFLRLSVARATHLVNTTSFAVYLLQAKKESPKY